MAGFEHSIDSAVRGFHVYKDVWSPSIHEQLRTTQELGNPEDEYAVAVVKDDDSSSSTTGTITVGHVPKEISRTCWSDSALLSDINESSASSLEPLQ